MERGVRPKRFDRFPVMGAALCFDNMKNTNTEPLKLLKPEMETGAGAAGQRRVGTWICLGKGGRIVGKWTGFSHLEPALTRLFPHVATQVVDFPHKATVTLFGEPGFYRGDTETQSQEEERDRMNNDYRHNGRNGRARPIRRFRILVAIFETEGAAKCA